MSTLLVIWAWCLAHPVIMIAVTTGVASLVYTKLDSYPKVHAFFSLLAGMGLDLPTILDAIRRLFTGSPPTVGKSGPYRTPATMPKHDPDATTDPGKPAAFIRYLGAVTVAAMIASVIFVPHQARDTMVDGQAGCTKVQGQEVKTAVQNLTPAGACILRQIVEGNTDPVSITGICLGVTIQDVLAEVEALLSGPADAGTKLTEFETHLITLRAKCLRLLKDGG